MTDWIPIEELDPSVFDKAERIVLYTPYAGASKMFALGDDVIGIDERYISINRADELSYEEVKKQYTKFAELTPPEAKL